MSSQTETPMAESLLSTLLSEDTFWPAAPQSIEETGLSEQLIESLIVKYLSGVGASSGRQIAEFICLPFGILDDLLHSLRSRQITCHTGSAMLNDYSFALTDLGRERARVDMEACSYTGSAPVPLDEYLLSVGAQTIRAEAPKRSALSDAFEDISVDPVLFECLGPAINSGAGLFLYGEPGNGKSTIAQRITKCFGQHIWIPRTIVEDNQLIKFFDAVYHHEVNQSQDGLLKTASHDPRWIKVTRPTVIVGGELTLESLEIRHDPRSNVSEAPLQLKSNCGLLLIDDFGRQRIEPVELLNRWIVPLEAHVDYLTLATGKKFEVPFDQLIIFSTNLEPKDLVDEAFLRRIPYKINITDPREEEFYLLFELTASTMRCEYRPEAIDHLLAQHYRPLGRALRRCHPRDLMGLVRNHCAYNDLAVEMLPEYFDRVVGSYFTAVHGTRQ